MKLAEHEAAVGMAEDMRATHTCINEYVSGQRNIPGRNLSFLEGRSMSAARTLACL